MAVECHMSSRVQLIFFKERRTNLALQFLSVTVDQPVGYSLCKMVIKTIINTDSLLGPG